MQRVVLVPSARIILAEKEDPSSMKAVFARKILVLGRYQTKLVAHRSVANHGKLTISSVVSKSWLLWLLYIQLTISFLIGRKRTVNFRNQRLGRHLAADYTIIMSRTLKVTGNHVMYDRGAWFLRVTMSSSRGLCCLQSVKKQKHDFQVCFVDRARHRKK